MNPDFHSRKTQMIRRSAAAQIEREWACSGSGAAPAIPPPPPPPPVRRAALPRTVLLKRYVVAGAALLALYGLWTLIF